MASYLCHWNRRAVAIVYSDAMEYPKKYNKQNDSSGLKITFGSHTACARNIFLQLTSLAVRCDKRGLKQVYVQHAQRRDKSGNQECFLKYSRTHMKEPVFTITLRLKFNSFKPPNKNLEEVETGRVLL